MCLDADIAREWILAEGRAPQPQRQTWRVRYDIVSRIDEVRRLVIVDRHRVAMILHGDLHIVPVTYIAERGCREVLQSTRARRHVVDGAGSLLVGTVGRGILVDLDLESSIGGNPRRIVSYILLQRWIRVGGQVRASRMRGMEPKENSRIVDWPAGASNRS